MYCCTAIAIHCHITAKPTPSLPNFSLSLLHWLRLYSSCPPSSRRLSPLSLSLDLHSPSYGSRAPQSPTGFDHSPPASPAQFKDLQVAIGCLLYYGRRSVDNSILSAACALACEQASPTTIFTLSRSPRSSSWLRLLASQWPQDLSSFRYDIMGPFGRLLPSRPRAGSVAGSVHYMMSSTNCFAIDPEAPSTTPSPPIPPAYLWSYPSPPRSKSPAYSPPTASPWMSGKY